MYTRQGDASTCGNDEKEDSREGGDGAMASKKKNKGKSPKFFVTSSAEQKTKSTGRNLTVQRPRKERAQQREKSRQLNSFMLDR